MGCKLLTLTNCIKVGLGCFVSHILGPKFLIKPRIGVICLMLQPPQLPVFPLCFQPRNLSGCSCQVTAWHTDSPYKQPLLTPRLLALNTSFFSKYGFTFSFVMLPTYVHELLRVLLINFLSRKSDGDCFSRSKKRPINNRSEH